MTYYQQQTHFPVPIQLTHHILYCEARQGSDLQSFYAQSSVITFQLYSNLLTLPLTFSKPLSSESNNTAHFFLSSRFLSLRGLVMKIDMTTFFLL